MKSFFASNLAFLRESLVVESKAWTTLTGLSAERLNGLEKNAVSPTPEELLVLSSKLKINLDRLLRIDLTAVAQLKARLELKFLALDIDGVLTDGGLYYAEQGNVSKKFNVKDGVAISRLCKHGFDVGFISSGSSSDLVKARAARLGVARVECEVTSKLEVLTGWCSDLKIKLKNVAYIGDDRNDLECMAQVGLSACPHDAMDEVKSAVDWILEKKGGEGCVREFVDLFLQIG